MKHILSLIKGGHRPDMAIAVDWDVKHHFKQTNKRTNKVFAWFWYTDSALFCLEGNVRTDDTEIIQ